MKLVLELRKEFQPRLLLSGITAGLIASLITISIEISLAALIFSGDLSPFLTSGSRDGTVRLWGIAPSTISRADFYRRGGATVGEMGLYLGAARTASVIASRPSTVYRLSAESLKKMREQDPEVAALLHEWIARLLAERLTANNRIIEALME
jgi:CRP-like cAMP-binding protein